MTTGLRFVKGARVLNLRGDVYQFERGFTPPATKHEVQTAQGTALNREGGRLISRKPVNREWSFDVGIDLDPQTVSGAQQAARALQRMLNEAGDEVEPLMVEYRLDDSLPDPLWGQFGAPLRYEVVQGRAEFERQGGLSWHQMPNLKLDMEIKPYARGLEQRVGRAVGAVYYERAGAAGNERRGLVVAEATLEPSPTNLITNPIFGNSTAWDTDWNTGTGCVVYQNTDKHFVYPGAKGSAQIVGTSPLLSDNSFTQHITTTGTVTLSVYVIKPDQSAVGTTDCLLIVDGDPVDTVYSSIGNGLYMLTASSATHVSGEYGIAIQDGHTIYVLAAQLEPLDYATPLCVGSFIGCAWDGTAHESSSTRTPGKLAILAAGAALQEGEGTIVLAWAPWYDSTNTNDRMLFRNGALGLQAWYQESDNAFHFFDNTNEVIGVAGPFAANDSIRLAFVYGLGGLAIYMNGALLASGTDYAANEIETYLYIGSDDDGGKNCGGRFMRFTTYDRALSAEQIAADDVLMQAALDQDLPCEAIPFLWTKDGDGQVDNSDDSTHDNWALVDGIGGSGPGRTRIELEYGSAGSEPLVWLSQFALDDFLAPDQNGLTFGSTETKSVNTAEVEFTGSQLTIDNRLLAAGEVYVLARVTDAGADLTGKVRVSYGLIDVDGDFVPIAADGTARLFVFGPMPIKQANALYDWQDTINVSLVFKRSIAGAANVTVDYLLIGGVPSLKIESPSGGIGGTIVLEGMRAVTRGETDFGFTLTEFLSSTGALIEAEPDRINLWLTARGEIGEAFSLTKTMNYTRVTITPRYELL